MRLSDYKRTLKGFQKEALTLAIELAKTPKGDWKRKHIEEDYKKALNDVDAMITIGERKGF